jgi:hypothetical protein
MAGVTRPDTPKVILIFAGGGITSGLLGGILGQLPILGVAVFNFFYGPGLYFLLALSGSVWFARRAGWLAITFAWKRCATSAAILIISYPLGLYGMAVPGYLEQWMLHTRLSLFLATHPEGLPNLDLFSSALVVSLLVWIALSIFIRAWNGKALLTFVMAGFLWLGVFLWVANRFEPQLKPFIPSGVNLEWTMITALLTVGECLFGGIIGYSLIRADARRLA